MNMKKLPYGISNYEELKEENYYYVDKTKYIEKLENLAEKRIMFLRPRKFGKSLFTSVLENYYDINKKDKFDELFKYTYIGKTPSKLKNSYHILRFNFSGINTKDEEGAILSFKREVASSINVFVKRYGLDFYTNENEEAEDILDNLFKAFYIQKQEEKIYVIIDEYDHFANELLGFKTEEFKNMISKNGKIRKWYEILKKGTETVVDRIFITGVAPITLDSMTSGFNIVKDLTQDRTFNEMMGFTEEEVIKMMKDQELTKEEQKYLLPIMKENYDGYRFSLEGEFDNNLYNSNMCLYFLNEYVKYKEIPKKLVDVNIASDYSKIGNMLRLCKGEKRLEIITKTMSGEGLISEITEKFNPEIGFGETEMISMLYYLGYLTIEDVISNIPKLVIPNKAIKEIYGEYFLKILSEEENLIVDTREYTEIGLEMLIEGKIKKGVDLLQKFLGNLSNRDYQNFDEKYVKVMFYCIAMSLKTFWVKSELEVEREYQDILLIPKELGKGYYTILIEFKYLKKNEDNKLEEKQKEAKEQIIRYSNKEEMKSVENLKKFTVVAINDKIYVEEIKSKL